MNLIKFIKKYKIYNYNYNFVLMEKILNFKLKSTKKMNHTQNIGQVTGVTHSQHQHWLRIRCTHTL